MPFGACPVVRSNCVAQHNQIQSKISTYAFFFRLFQVAQTILTKMAAFSDKLSPPARRPPKVRLMELHGARRGRRNEVAFYAMPTLLGAKQNLYLIGSKEQQKRERGEERQVSRRRRWRKKRKEFYDRGQCGGRPQLAKER